jgi:hypothetical protein
MNMENNNTESKHNYEIPVEEIGRLLDEVSTKLPKLLEGIQRSYYSPESGMSAGKSIGAFYKELISSGIPQDVALRLTENYMVSFKDLANLTVNNNNKND